MKELFGKHWFSWQRLACVLLTAVALTLLVRRVGLAGLGTAFSRMAVGWFLLSLVCYGAALLFTAIRWHLVLWLTGSSVHLSATIRLAFIGHYFVLILFGGVAGDVAKSSVYARWYQRGFPEVYASSPLDRLLGLGGLILFGLAAFGFAAWNGGLEGVPSLEIRWPLGWVVAVTGLVLLAGAALLAWEPRGDSSPERLLRSIQAGGKRLLRRPRLAWAGLGCGFVVQLFLTAVLALNLRAVTEVDLPWKEMLWTFPVISVLSGLPVTVAGLGVREGASIVLLGLFGVSSPDAIAASLLSLATNLFWGAMGGLLLWRDDRLVPSQPGPPLKTISVVIPTLNEAEALRETVQRARQVPEIREIIVVDGGSRDSTSRLARELGCQVLLSPPGRGRQLRTGATAAQSDVILLLHADTWLPIQAGQALLDCLRDRQVVGGGFWKSFRESSPWLAGARWKCALRLLLGRRIHGDQGLFARREVLERIGGVPDMPLMEEFELCRRLRKAGRLALADATVITSARRFARLGMLRTYLRMCYVTLLYRAGIPPQRLREIYDRD